MRTVLAAAAIILSSSAALAHGYRTGDLEIVHPADMGVVPGQLLFENQGTVSIDFMIDAASH